MAQGTGLTRGDRRRNGKIAALRAVVRRDAAILAIDLGEDKQVAAVMDHDGRVLGRKRLRAKAHALSGLLDWAGSVAARNGYTGVVVGCEPTGHRWQSVMAQADEAGVGFVCVQSLQVNRARESDDYTRDKTDYKDTALIGRLIARLECYLPERAGSDWALLRHLGQHRQRHSSELIACRNQIRDLLGCAWPAALAEVVAKPVESTTWLAALAVTVAHSPGDPAGLAAAWTETEFVAAVRAELPRWGGKRLGNHVAERFYATLTDPRGVAVQRRGALERAGLLLDDCRWHQARLGEVEARMAAVLDELGLAALVASIPGLSVLGAAAILAETGDPARFASARAVVKHAGLNPTEQRSATLSGPTRISRRGRPGLRAAAWRAVWAALGHNPVLQAKFTHLSTRDRDRLTPEQARVACAATLLRWLHAIVTQAQPFDATIAAGNVPAHALPAAA